RRLFTRRRLVTALLTLAVLLPLWRDSPVSGQEPIVLKEALVIPPVGRYSRTALHTDGLEAEIVAGRWKAPQAGDKVTLPGGAESAWEKGTAGEDGTVNHKALRGGYLYWSVPADAERVMVLEASGHAMAYVNGEPRVGDFYQSGYVRLPVLLRKGTNDLLFHCVRRAASVSGTLRARLVPPKGEAYLDPADALIPDLLDNDRQRRAWAAVIVGNASPRTRDGLVLVAHVEGVS